MNSPTFRTAAIATVLAAASLPAFASGSCHVDSLVAIGFGIYDVFASAPNNSGVGSITISCSGNLQHAVITLSAGHSNSFASRVLSSGAKSLNYNLYTNASRSTVWGDGTGGSRSVTINADRSTTLSVFGQIPARQDASVGTYTDSILQTVEF
jgi:spore coat protein U-like protein